MNQNRNSLFIFLLVFGLSSCGIFNQNYLFQSKNKKNKKKESNIIGDSLLNEVSKIESNYKIQESDQIDIKVYTNKGERLVDPNGEFVQSIANLSTAAQTSINGMGNYYTVMQNGTAAFPMVGVLQVKNLTTRQLDSLLQVKFSAFYQDVFVISKVVNRRVIVIGNQAGNSLGTGGGSMGNISTGGGLGAHIVNLTNEKMNLIEILSLAGGLDEQAISYRIKLVRGNLNNPNVYQIDLSTIEGMKQSQMYVQPNDIIYVERMRKPIRQIMREMYPFLSVSSFATSIILLIVTLTK